MKIKEIRLVKITDLPHFDPDEFCVTPSHHAMNKLFSCPFIEKARFFDEARKLSETVDNICIAIIATDEGEFALTESCNKGLSNKFILFNAARDTDGNVRAVTFNTGKGALSTYWFDEMIRFEPGSIV